MNYSVPCKSLPGFITSNSFLKHFYYSSTCGDGHKTDIEIVIQY